LRELGLPLQLEERPNPLARGTEVVVRVDACGVCHSDVHQVDWGATTLPIVLGHEIAGEAATSNGTSSRRRCSWRTRRSTASVAATLAAGSCSFPRLN
jgi:propanol-preferring alcohol dehydrogenase